MRFSKLLIQSNIDLRTNDLRLVTENPHKSLKPSNLITGILAITIPLLTQNEKILSYYCYIVKENAMYTPYLIDVFGRMYERRRGE